MFTTVEKAIYGGVFLYRFICPICGDKKLTKSLNIQCDECGENFECNIKTIQIVIDKAKRSKIKSKIMKQVRKEQGDLCYWCGRKFGGYYIKNYKILQLRCTFDHIIPDSFSRNATKGNIVVSCNLCNSWKHSKVFKTEQEIRKYLMAKWRKELIKEKVILC